MWMMYSVLFLIFPSVIFSINEEQWVLLIYCFARQQMSKINSLITNKGKKKKKNKKKNKNKNKNKKNKKSSSNNNFIMTKYKKKNDWRE